MATRNPFIEILPGEPIVQDDQVAVTTEGVFPAPTTTPTITDDIPFSWMFDEDGDGPVQADGFFFGSGFMWPSQGEVATAPPAGPASLVGSASVVASNSAKLTHTTSLISSVSVVASNSGDVTQSISLSGSISVVAGSSGTATTLHALSGSVSAVAGNAAQIVQFGLQQLSGTVTVVAGAQASFEFLITAAGRGTYVFAYLDNGTVELAATITGDAALDPDLGVIGDYPYQPLNYPLVGDKTIDDLFFELTSPPHILTSPRAEVTPVLDLHLSSTITGDSTATFGPVDNPDKFEVIINGEATVTAELFVSGAGELATTINGDSFMFFRGRVPADGTGIVDITRAYYIYGNVTAGFDPTDLVGGTDGDIKNFNRYLYLYHDIGVGFDYTDDVSLYSTFVSQSYPDGDIVRDFGRYKYQYVNLIPPIEGPFCRLTVGPAPRSPGDLTPTERPPRRKR